MINLLGITTSIINSAPVRKMTSGAELMFISCRVKKKKLFLVTNKTFWLKFTFKLLS